MRMTRVSTWIVCGLLASPFAAVAQRSPRPRTPARPETGVLTPLAGTYADVTEPDVLLSVSTAGENVMVEGARSPRVEAHPDAKDRFVADTQVYQFQRDAGGTVTGVTVTGGRRGRDMVTTYKKTGNTPAALNHFRNYVRSEVMVPVRDGVKLHTVILRPEGSETGEPLPIVMQRTPYGVAMTASDGVNASKPEMAASGYIFVAQDCRGRYGSEGQFVMNRAMVHKVGDRTDTSLVDESTDAYDTVAWLIKNVANNNGRVGAYGVSYPGFLAMMTGVDHHPAVKAISPQAPMTDVWMGDDFFHNGAFRETYSFDYTQQLEGQKTDKRVSMQEDTYNYFLRYGNFAGAAKAANMENLPTAKRFIDEPAYTKFWRDMSVVPRLTSVEVPTLEVGGFWDQEDMYGTQAEYAALRQHDEKKDPDHRVFMVLGPWNHGGWGATTRHLGTVDFGEPTGDEYRKRYEFPFFEKYLKGKAGFDLMDTATFRTGSNKWKQYDVWPPRQGFHAARLFLAPKQSLSFAKPTGKDERSAASYVADPSNPIPYRERPIQSTYGEGSKWRPWLISNQSFLKGRKDLLNFSTAPMEKDTTITGDIVADLFAATTGSDADWVVKLIDVYPDDAPEGMGGYQLMIVDEIFRGRYAKSFETPAAIEPNKVQEYKWSLHAADHTFRKGHKIMVQVQSSWFPLYDRNPQTFVPNIMTAPADAYKAQTQTVFFSAKHPSHLDVLMPDTED